MSSSANPGPACHVVGGDKLPAASGGPTALCAAIEQAIAQRLPGASFTVTVTVSPRSQLAASLTVDGKALPEQKFARMDRELDQIAFERFAQALADQAANADR